MRNIEEKYKLGVCGVGIVGGALRGYFEKKGIKPSLYDKGKNIGSLEEVNQADIIFICVLTPFNKEKGFDLSFIEEACQSIRGEKIIVIKSTILPGTTEKLQKKYPQHKFLFNPEFLTEVTAKQDVECPDRQILGYTKESRDIAEDVLQILPSAPFKKIIPAAEAEMVKYFSNTWFSTKVVFANQIYKLCKKLDIDYETVRECAAADKMVGPSHLDVHHKGYFGYGGKCLSGEEIVYEVTDDGLKIVPIKDFNGKRILSTKDEKLIIDEVLVKSQREIKKTIKFYFSKGRTLETSPDHLMVMFDKNKGLIQKEARNIGGTDKIPIVMGQISLTSQNMTLDFFQAFNKKGEVFIEEIDRSYVNALKPYLTLHQHIGFRRKRNLSLPVQALIQAKIPLGNLRIKTGKTGSWIPNSLRLDKDFARLIGYYLSEGCSSGGRVLFSFGYQETELIEDLISILNKFNIKFSKNIGWWKGHKSALTIKISSKILSDYFKQFGKNCYSKSIPDFIFSASQEIKDQLLCGLFRGDGSINKSNKGTYYTISYATVSRNLIEGVDLLLREKGILASRKKWKAKKSKVPCYEVLISESKDVRKVLPLLTSSTQRNIKISSQTIKSPAYKKVGESIALLDIKKIERLNKPKLVYALETQSHYYLTSGGILTHNCLPKDIRALIQFADEHEFNLKLHKIVEEINNQLMKEQGIDDSERPFND